ncbi:hypothetical protein H072_9412 [Dactylellina haptotyla CBS 200.50]|uniref:Uncharacterized protein n=1 Tax=Dactylellina haptotyla (strain CBS 200.50) TaxID=1284197 RepID=S8BCT4_DACHA|nr:hypothetical protein H072_9412 [Dactylellina haptotyla CBS 200.50]
MSKDKFFIFTANNAPISESSNTDEADKKPSFLSCSALEILAQLEKSRNISSNLLGSSSSPASSLQKQFQQALKLSKELHTSLEDISAKLQPLSIGGTYVFENTDHEIKYDRQPCPEKPPVDNISKKQLLTPVRKYEDVDSPKTPQKAILSEGDEPTKNELTPFSLFALASPVDENSSANVSNAKDKIENWRKGLPCFKGSSLHVLDKENRAKINPERDFSFRFKDIQAYSTPMKEDGPLSENPPKRSVKLRFSPGLDKHRRFSDSLLQGVKLQHSSPPTRKKFDPDHSNETRNCGPSNTPTEASSDGSQQDDFKVEYYGKMTRCEADVEVKKLLGLGTRVADVEKLRHDKFFTQPQDLKKMPKGPEKQKLFFEQALKEQWDQLWIGAYNTVRSKEKGVYNPTKLKREYKKRGEEIYDPIQTKRGSLEWSIHQVFECYFATQQTKKEMQRLRQTEKELRKAIETSQQREQSDDLVKLSGYSGVSSAHIEQNQRTLEVEIPDQLKKLHVRQTLLKRAGEAHLWDIAKEDHKYQYQGEMLYGILKVRKYFADIKTHVTDEELKDMGLLVRNDSF